MDGVKTICSSLSDDIHRITHVDRQKDTQTHTDTHTQTERDANKDIQIPKEMHTYKRIHT